MQSLTPLRSSHPRDGGPVAGHAAATQAGSKAWPRSLPSLAAVAACGCVAWLAADRLLVDRRPIVVGILHSPSGPLAASERAVIEAEILAIEEINQAGGLLGRPVRAVLADADPETGGLARQAERLIRDERASVIIGCGTIADRRSILPVLERADHLLIQPRCSEGLEMSPAVVYAGAVANQQVMPAVQWCHEALAARRFLLVGPDDVRARCINAIAADQIRGVGDEVVGAFHFPVGNSAGEDAVQRVIELDPDVVLCSFAGDAAAAFFRKLRTAGVQPEGTPIVAVELSEDDLRRLDVEDVVGHYAVASYFQSIERPENLAFIRAFKARYGEDRATADAIVGGYDAVRLWAQAVREAGSAEVRRVRETLRHQSLDAPAGVIAVDPDTQHTWQPVFIGRVRGDRQFEIVWSSRTAVRPVPFPISRSRSAWERFVRELQRERGTAVATGSRGTPAGEPLPR